MKKKNLAILLVMPFLLALFGIAAIKTAFNIIDNDIVWIDWSYDVQEFFEVGKEFELTVDNVVLANNRYPASEGNRLKWSIRDAEATEDICTRASITTDDDGKGHLITKSEGDVVISLTTEKGNYVPKTINANIHGAGGALAINTVIGGSDQRVDSTLYFGEYDLVNGEKQRAVIDIKIKASAQSILEDLEIDTQATTDDITLDMDKGKIYINKITGELSVLKLKNDVFGISTTFAFKTVKDGINVYSYDDLLYCTNRSENGEIAVLRTHFQNKKIADMSKATNIQLFGTQTDNGFNFINEVYTFSTTYNSEYVDMWNDFANSSGNDSGYKPIDDKIIAGLHVQKDFYGNGYLINMHNLCFPTSYLSERDETGVSYDRYVPGKNDLFRGPKPFYLLGDPNSSVPLVTAYGQDNIGMYVDGDNITVNDVRITNCVLESPIRNNLDYVGTVMEVYGSNNTVKNSQLSYGKNTLRSFSSMNLTIDNCILATSRNFLIEVGSNEYEKNHINDNTKHDFFKLDGSKFNGTLKEYIEAEGDNLLSIFVAGIDINAIMNGEEITDKKYDNDKMKAALHSIQDALNRSDVITSDTIKGSANINNTLFYDSGIASIGVETMFNGPFLFNNNPSAIELLLKTVGEKFLTTAIPKFPDNISGASYPVAINISGETRFYDYKDINKGFDISGLIDQHISEVAGTLIDKEITIDHIFPLKAILKKDSSINKTLFKVNGNEYINIPIAFYGGGGNLSTVTTNNLTSSGLTQIYEVDLLDEYLVNNNSKIDLSAIIDGIVSGSMSPSDILKQNGFMNYMQDVLTKTVTTVIGFESFKFQFINNADGLYDYEKGEFITPNYQDIQKRA